MNTIDKAIEEIKREIRDLKTASAYGLGVVRFYKGAITTTLASGDRFAVELEDTGTIMPAIESASGINSSVEIIANSGAQFTLIPSSATPVGAFKLVIIASAPIARLEKI